ncbi:MAG: glutathione synthase [Candidatus Binatia bacterium]
MSLRFAFVMDPLERILPDKDTTFMFMLEACRRGHEAYYVGLSDLYVERGVPYGRARRAHVMRPTAADPVHHRLHEERTERLDWFDAVFMRKDPPFDMAYFFATHMLSLVDATRTVVLNDPRGLREANEKLYALHFPDIIPESLVSADLARLKAFMDELGGEMIVKPLDGAGGAGVFHVRRGDRNLNAILESATQDGRRLIMAQRYLPEIRQGDKRIVVLDGEPLGAVLRVPREDETRGNIHVGGTTYKAPLTARDRAICARIAPRLRSDGLWFVGLDVIGDWLTEINVTSPTGIQEINQLDGVALEADVIDFIEQHVRALRAGADRLDRTPAAR